MVLIGFVIHNSKEVILTCPTKKVNTSCYLLLPNGNFDADTLASLLETCHQADELASELSGREPDLSPIGTEKLPLAIVPSTCGPGCGRLGRKGIEITEKKFLHIYEQFVKHGK